MNQLRKEHPRTYERIIREKAIPYVAQLRELYYLDIWNYYSLLQNTGRTVFFYDSERTHTHFAHKTKALEQAEHSLYKAGQETGLEIPEPVHYDPMRVISRILTDRLSVSVGTCSEEELRRLSGNACTSFFVPQDAFFSSDLNDYSYAASLRKDGITITCRTQDAPQLKTRLTRAPDLDHKIKHASNARSTQPNTQAKQELKPTR
jgi:hypothetical protein